MKRFANIVLVAVLFVFSAYPVFAADLPKPPPGLAWQEIPEMKAALLKPDGWHFKKETKNGTIAYFITKEDVEKTGQFDTGLTVNVFHLKTDSAVVRGQGLIEKMATEHHEKSWSRTVGPFQEFGCLLKDTDASGTIVMHALTVANPKTNTLYLFIFESPESEWDAAWKLGKPIMDTLALDDEY